MSIKPKSKLLNILNNDISNLHHSFFKKCKSSNFFYTKDKTELSEFLNSHYDTRLSRIYDFILGKNFFHFFELEKHFLIIMVDLEIEFSDLDELKNKPNVHFMLNSKDLQINNTQLECKFSCHSFNVLSKNFIYLYQFLNEYDSFEKTQNSPKSERMKFFINIFFNENRANEFIENFKINEIEARNLLVEKNEFLDKRVSNNRAKKINKVSLLLKLMQMKKK